MPTIDLSGPQGNAFALMGALKGWGRQLGIDTTATITDMMAGDYDHLLQVMRDWCAANHIDLELEGRDDDNDE